MCSHGPRSGVITRRRLPGGLAILRVRLPSGTIVVVSDQLSVDESRIAQAVASDRARSGANAIMLDRLELAATLADIRDERRSH